MLGPWLSGRGRSDDRRAQRSGWLRAAVLGADDGIVSTASLMLGVAASNASRAAVITAGLAGLVAGAMSMAGGEYVSVSSQRDAERADLDRQRQELAGDPDRELAELARTYIERGLEPSLARQVAAQLTAHDALATHARDRLGLTDWARARPLQAAWVSAAAFAVGGLLPLLAGMATPVAARTPVLAGAALAGLALLGGIGALAGGAGWARGAARVLVAGAAAMVVTAAVGHLAGVAGL
ncbi:MAG TPA: VIT family protein [Candidatus Dormibacteraeota bacterium]|nr:VIT family protein [Candidatus Dormibacteraeota bacterium]